MTSGQFSNGRKAGEREHVRLRRAVVAAALDGPASGDQVRVIREREDDLLPVPVTAEVGVRLPVLLFPPLPGVAPGVFAGLLAPPGFQLIGACRAGQIVVVDPGGGKLAAVLAQHVPRGQRHRVGPQARGHLRQDMPEPGIGGAESLGVKLLGVVAD